jgi:[ribosomal protein S5]-alanine N-acetyltransferase
MKGFNRTAITFAVLYTAYVVYYLNRKGYGLWMEHSIAELGVPKRIASLPGSAFEIFGGFSKVFLAFVVDVNSPARVLGLALIGSALCNLLLCFVDNRYWIALIWGINGVLQALGWPALAKVFLLWFPDPKTRGFLYAFLSTNQNVGATLSGLLLPYALNLWGWRASMWVPAVFGLMFGSFILIVLKDRPPNGIVVEEGRRGDMTASSIETSRLLLRPFVDADKLSIPPLVGDYEVAKMLSVVPFPYTEEDSEYFLKNVCPDPNGITFAIIKKQDNVLIGAVSLMNVHSEGRCEIGYWLGRRYWRRGYMSEAAKAMLSYGFNNLGVQVVNGGHYEENTPSGKVMLRVGFQHLPNHPQQPLPCRARGNKSFRRVFYRITKSQFAQTMETQQTERPSSKPSLNDFYGKILNNPTLWVLGVAYFCVSVARTFVEDWARTMLRELFGVSAKSSLVAFQFGGVVSGISGGIISDKCFDGRRAPVIAAFSIAIAAPLLFIAVMEAGPFSFLYVLELCYFFLGFFSFAPHVLIGLAAREWTPENLRSTAGGFVKGLSCLGAAIAGSPMGALIEANGWHVSLYIISLAVVFGGFVLLPLWNFLGPQMKAGVRPADPMNQKKKEKKE